MSNDLDIDRRWMAEMLMKIAATRESDQDAAHDPRYSRAATNLRHTTDFLDRLIDISRHRETQTAAQLTRF